MGRFPLDPGIAKMSRLEILRELIDFGRSRGYELQPSDFEEFGHERLQHELADLRRHGVNSWVSSIGELVTKSHSRIPRR